jgi:carbon storage regulator
MLVLSRMRDESIKIGDDIEVMIVDIRDDKVRLGITAPKSTPIHRKEIYELIRQKEQEASPQVVAPANVT